MSTRRNARLRREYLYRRSVGARELAHYEKKKKVKEALQEGRPIPTELRDVAADLERELEVGAALPAPRTLDDEYLHAGTTEPKLLLTTSRDPSVRLVKFVKELKLLFPGAARVNRGGHVLGELVAASKQHGYTDLIIAHETRGVPDGLIVSHLPFGPTAYFSIANVVMRHDIRTDLEPVSTVNPHLVFAGFSTALGRRVTAILRYLFPPTKTSSQRVMSFTNSEDYISFRHHTWTDTAGQIELSEIGPRFELFPYKVILGTLDMKDAQTEWVRNTYTNTARKKLYL